MLITQIKVTKIYSEAGEIQWIFYIQMNILKGFFDSLKDDLVKVRLQRII